MNRCTICGYKIKELETFCNNHKEMIDNFYIPEHHLTVQFFIIELIKKQLVDIYYIKQDKMLPPIEYKEINGREKFLEYSKKETKENLDNRIHNELRSIFHFNCHVENKLNCIHITLNNGGFDYEAINKLNENGFIFQHITYKTKLFSRDVKCVISVTFDPEIPKEWETAHGL